MDNILMQIEVTLKQEYGYVEGFDAKISDPSTNGQDIDCILEYRSASIDAIERLERMKGRMKHEGN